MYDGILFSHDIGENPAVCNSLYEPRVHTVKQISQTEKDKYYISLIYGILETHTQRNRRIKWLSGAGSERNAEILVKGYKLLVIRLTGMVIIVNNTVSYA